jgi:hypothetical protein
MPAYYRQLLHTVAMIAYRHLIAGGGNGATPQCLCSDSYYLTQCYSLTGIFRIRGYYGSERSASIKMYNEVAYIADD